MDAMKMFGTKIKVFICTAAVISLFFVPMSVYGMQKRAWVI
ncbi:hypothetical protein V1225_14465 [Emergencia sp. JLR.KK010]